MLALTAAVAPPRAGCHDALRQTGEISLDAYRSQIFLHVVFVIVTLGGIFLFPWMQAAAERRGTAATLFYIEFVTRVLRLLVLPGAVIVFIFGGLLMSNDHFAGHKDPPGWLIASIIVFLVVGAISALALRATLRDAQASLRSAPIDGPLPAEYRPLGQRLQGIFGVAGIAIIVIAFLMVQQP